MFPCIDTWKEENMKELMELLRNDDWRYQPIPEVSSVEGWKKKPIQECREPLAALGMFGKYSDIMTVAMYYPETNISPYVRTPVKGSLLTMFVREGVAQRLRVAQARLPQGMYFVVLDPYRTIETQESLYRHFYDQLKAKRPDWNEEELTTYTQQFVSLPSLDPQKPSPHNTGGAVDLTIVRLTGWVDFRVRKIQERIAEIGWDIRNWQEVYALEMERNVLFKQYGEELDFGTAFDNASEQTALAYYESKKFLSPRDLVIRKNRRLLYNVMASAGFQSYADEWWHWNYGNQMAARTSDEQFAIYGAIELTDEQKKFEQMRQRHLYGSEQMRHQSVYTGKDVLLRYLYSVAQRQAVRNESLQIVKHMNPGETIRPIL